MLRYAFPRSVADSSVVAVQVFDQRKFKRKDQGFLGVVNVKVADVLDIELGGHGRCILLRTVTLASNMPFQKCLRLTFNVLMIISPCQEKL
jgi:hypothetical protein